jgi:hypothetical protein
MDADNKHFETGSNPYYLNLNNTSIEMMTIHDSTNPEYGFMNFLNQHILVEQPIEILDSLKEDEKENTVPNNG